MDYHAFPIDTGSVVVNNLLNHDNRFELSIVSCNMYADRAETVVWGKAVADALEKDAKRTAIVAVTSLSRRLHTRRVADADDHVSSQMDDEWNRKLLELWQTVVWRMCLSWRGLLRLKPTPTTIESHLVALRVMGAHNKYRDRSRLWSDFWNWICRCVSHAK